MFFCIPTGGRDIKVGLLCKVFATGGPLCESVTATTESGSPFDFGNGHSYCKIRFSRHFIALFL